MTHQQVIDRLLATYAPLPFEESCDGFKAGCPSAHCSGVVTTCVLSPNVIRQAVSKGCNLIIVHEPSFFTHEDKTDWLEGDPVYTQIMQLMMEHQIAVWRNHDHMHSAPKDEIMIGVLKALGWEFYADRDACRFQQVITIPETTLYQLAVHLKDRLRLSTGRIVGNPEAKVSRIAFCAHIFPSWNEEEQKPTKLAGREDIDVLIPGELIDWTVVPYIRDAAQLGMNKAIIQVGHFNLEEPGMQYMAEKMAGLVPELPVCFIPSGDPYFFV